MTEVLLKLSGVRIECPKCKRIVPIQFVDESKNCVCGTRLELSPTQKQNYINKFNLVGHT